MQTIVSFLLSIVMLGTAFAHNLDNGGSSFYSEENGYTDCGLTLTGMTVTTTGATGWCYNENTGFLYFGTGYGVFSGDVVIKTGSSIGFTFSGMTFNENIGYTVFPLDNSYYSGVYIKKHGKFVGYGWNENGGFENMSATGYNSMNTTLWHSYVGDYNFDWLVNTADFTLVSGGLGSTYTFDDLVDVVLNQ